MKNIGKVYGNYEIVEKDLSRGDTYYFIKCLLCGELMEQSYAFKSIRTKTIKQCFCTKTLVGQRFNFLEVVSYNKELSKEKRQTYYNCKCHNCNRDRLVPIRASYLKNGNSKSCGCLNDDAHRENLIGKTFGQLKVISLNKEKTYDEDRKSTGSIWNCECLKCHSICTVAAKTLKSGRQYSCGCLKSKSESKIKELLEINHISFIQQYLFKDLIGEKDCLKFDFAIFELDNLVCLIECQGEQHYNPVDHFGGEKQFLRQQSYDNKKREYCKKHNLKLIEIPYWDFDKIDSEYLLNLIK